MGPCHELYCHKDRIELKTTLEGKNAGTSEMAERQLGTEDVRKIECLKDGLERGLPKGDNKRTITNYFIQILKQNPINLKMACSCL